ncbi:MAG TPA: M1 family aminopeptidase, partial [Vicinamibacteria bacterium]
FAVGPFRSVAETHGRVRLEYWGTEFTDDELRWAFAETRPMLDFFEERAGVPYPGRTYTQVLAAGRVEQEVGHFTLLGESYGRRLLDDPKDLWLMAHELAHQWWGNGVTCVDWMHFWLNEGMATFLAAAYRETRFGREAYLKEIDEARLAYEGVRKKGADKALVFADWLKPSADDRVIVYSKGAYVLHLLRESLGDALFWEGLRSYTRRHMGGSVTTADFLKAMEESTRRDLSGFFRQWVYSPDNPHITELPQPR